jgi:hypothetical protein
VDEWVSGCEGGWGFEFKIQNSKFKSLPHSALRTPPLPSACGLQGDGVFPLFVHVLVGGNGGGGDPVEVAENPVLKDGIQNHGESSDKQEDKLSVGGKA